MSLQQAKAETIRPETEPIGSSTRIWVLLGTRFGDNQQMLTLAEATGAAYDEKQLVFNWKSGMPNILLGPHLSSIEKLEKTDLNPPWPNAVISSGRRSVPVARWIGKQSGGRTKLIHIGRPWGPLAWFDLIVTTPQYGLPKAENVCCNLMPLSMPPPAPVDLPAAITVQIGAIPKPWVVLVLGGDSRPYVFNETAAIELAGIADDQARKAGGGLIVLAGPRTRKNVVETLRLHLRMPAFFHPWNPSTNPYPMMRHQADRFIVTGDSAAVIADTAASGRPTTVFDLPMQPDFRTRIAKKTETLAARHPVTQRLFDQLVDWGLVSSLRDLGAYRRALEAEGLLEGGPKAAERQACELNRSAERVNAIMIEPNAGGRTKTYDFRAEADDHPKSDG